MVQNNLLTQTIVTNNTSSSVVTEPVFLWKFFEEPNQKLYIDRRSTLKGTFIGERLINTGLAVQIKPVSRMKEPAPALWSGFILLGLILFLVLIKGLASRKYRQLLTAMLNNTNLSLLLREWNPLNSLLSNIIAFIYIVSISFFVQNAVGFLSSDSGNSFNNLILFLEILVGISFLFGLKLIIVRFLAYLFKTKEETARYLTNHIGFYALGGVILWPLLLLIVYNPSNYIIIISAGIIFILLIYKIIRVFLSAMAQPPFSILYLFLYLCTLEILPLILLTKTLLMFSNGTNFQ